MTEIITEWITHYGSTVGYVILFAIIFAESGLFFGFFLPGDSLLLTVGLLASRGFMSMWVLLPLLFIAAVLGDNVGYWFGAKTGPRIFTREESLLFKPKNLLAAKAFYEKHGGKTIVLARFMPFIRTFAPIVAGAVEMNYRSFFIYNLLGGALWAIGVTVLGYLVGFFFGQVEGMDKYFTLVVIAVIFISALPAMMHVWNDNRHEIFAWIQKLLNRRAVRDTEPDL
ncbi:MAG: VTT domain-containing protein [Chloroflexi bacterium]|nr:VTT domain-containing protein [Chloroflexota bacterium]MBI5054408.1 VTT domain-containing protein [Chloroflexota bacterium]MBI5081926.1 VTT domain-containing protein [Chloroflexota bacterium]MBI5350502.1 VTT domain-containing protein [Chloroflexota bacterium]MBI5712867.1 VTT domain-containing protein [Chloroflexota bacterium]